MIYNDYIINHTDTDFTPFKEANALIDFSHGDLLELVDILKENKYNEWGKGLLKQIEETLKKTDEHQAGWLGKKLCAFLIFKGCFLFYFRQINP